MKEETVVKFSEPLAKEIEEFLREHPEHGSSVEEFVTSAARNLREQLWTIRREQMATTTLPQDPGSRPQDEPPMTAEGKQGVLKELVSEFRKLRASSQAASDRGGIQ